VDGVDGVDAPDVEEFVTVLLVQLTEDGGLSMVNCGHPWPYLIDVTPEGAPWVEPLEVAEPLPPLGVLDAAAAREPARQARLGPGQTLLLHTDGAEEARDAAGAFFALAQALGVAARRARAGGRRLDPGTLVSAVRAALLAHVGGALADDVALLALARDPAKLPRTPGGRGAQAGPHGPVAAQLPPAQAQL
jgi:serine phosphatase RsbU (regulator of sigma subunit)